MPKASMVDVSNIIDQTPPGTPPEGTPPPADPPASDDTNPPADPPAKDTPPADPPASLDLTPEPTKVSVDETGYEEFDTVGAMLGEKGVENANAIMEQFMDDGELSLENKATMIEALGESVAMMAFKQMESAATGIIDAAKADSAKTMDYANTKFGGEDSDTTWKQIQEYARTPEAGFSEADLAAMNTMLDAGGLQAELVIDRIHKVYNADPKVSVPGTLLEGDSVNTGLTFEPISRADYTAAMGKAVREHGEDSHQVRELDKRRTLSMQRGI